MSTTIICMYNWFELFSSNNVVAILDRKSYFSCPKIGLNRPLKSGTRLLQVNYLEITTTFNKTLILKLKHSNIKSQKNLHYSFCLPPQTHDPTLVRTLLYLLKPPQFRPHHHRLCQNITFTTHFNKCFLYLIKYLINIIKYFKNNKKDLKKNKND